MIKKSDSFDNWGCHGGGTEHENHIIIESYNVDSALLNISSDSSDTFTASLPPTNFYFVPVKTINSFEGYRQKLTKPKKRPHLQYFYEKYYFQDEDTLILSEWRHS